MTEVIDKSITIDYISAEKKPFNVPLVRGIQTPFVRKHFP